jgi:methionyl-tRNA formyltransferase
MIMARLRTVFMGTAPLSCVSLRALLRDLEIEVVAVVTQPDRLKGRDLKLQPSPVKELALGQRLPVLQPERARNEAFLEELRALSPDLVVVAAFGQILPPSILELPAHGCLNVHTSLLPKYRGAGPIQWAILNDEPETGITIMKMDQGLDTGAILTQEKTPIYPGDTAVTLHDRLAEMGAGLLVRTIPGYVSGAIQPRAQPTEGVSYAPKIKKEDGLVDWNLPARTIGNRVRGLVPWPGAFTWLTAGSKKLLLKLWQVEVIEASGTPGAVLQADKNGIVVGCGRQALRILELQLEGSRRLSAPQFLAGHRLSSGLALDR